MRSFRASRLDSNFGGGGMNAKSEIRSYSCGTRWSNAAPASGMNAAVAVVNAAVAATEATTARIIGTLAVKLVKLLCNYLLFL